MIVFLLVSLLELVTLGHKVEWLLEVAFVQLMVLRRLLLLPFAGDAVAQLGTTHDRFGELHLPVASW